VGKNILVNEQVDAGNVFVIRFNKYMPVSLAMWAELSESGNLFLYIASDGINDTNFDIAYGEVLRLLPRDSDSFLDPFQVKLLNTNDPMAKEAIEIRDRHTAPLITNYGGSSLGGVSIESAKIYPKVSQLNRKPQ
jgi:hypothetical protein